MHKKILFGIAAMLMLVAAFVVVNESEDSDAAEYYYLEAKDVFNSDYGNFYFSTTSYISITNTTTVEDGITVRYSTDHSNFTISSSNTSVTTIITKTNVSTGQEIDWSSDMWEYNSYGYTFNLGVRYYANGGTNPPANQYYYSVTSNVTNITLSNDEPTPPAGARFLGWAFSATATAPDLYPGDLFVKLGEQLTNLYAVYETQTIYTFNLVYDARGGTNAPATQTWSGTATSYTFTVTSSTPTPPAGSTFYGWNDNPLDDQPYYTAGVPVTVTISGGSTTATVTLYAIYDLPTYTVRINVNNPNYGSVSPSVVYNVPKYTGVTYANNEMWIGNQHITVNKNPGYQWGFWSNNITGTDLDAWITSDITFTANLTASLYTVYFDNDYSPNGRVSPSSIGNIPYGTPITVNGNTITINGITVTATPDQGYSFSWWSCIVPSGNIPSTVTGDMRITAYFTSDRTYTLYFDMKGGTPQIPMDSSITPSTTSSYTFDIPWTVPTKAGYLFQGWCASPAATVVDYDPGDQITVTWASGGTQTLYAVWQEGNYHVFNLIYDMKGGTPQISTDSYQGSVSTTSHLFTISSAIPTKTGYDFLGWSDSSAATTVNYNRGDNIRVYWDVSTDTGDKTLYAVWQEQIVPTGVVYWSNDMYNGQIDMLFRFPSTDAREQIMTMDLYSGVVGSNLKTVWSKNGYSLEINVIYPNTAQISVTLLYNGTAIPGFIKTLNLGTWQTYQLTIDPSNGVVYAIPVNQFNSFMDYTLYDSQKKVILDFSSQIKNSTIYTIEHYIGDIGNQPVRFSVVSTRVFLETYGTVLNNPTINVYQYFPQYDSYRLNFYSFAIYGDSISLNGTTYSVINGQITVSYVDDNQGNHIIPTGAPGETVKTKTMPLSNIYVTWDDLEGHCYLTFVDNRFTIDMGTYTHGNEVVSFGGMWYFTTFLYEPHITNVKELGDWETLPTLDKTQICLIFAGLCIVIGAALYIKHVSSIIDTAIIVLALVADLIIMGG